MECGACAAVRHIGLPPLSNLFSPYLSPSLPPTLICVQTTLSQVDLDCLSDAYRTEQREYYMNTSAWAEVHPAQLLGPGVLLKSYDLNTVTLEELKVGGCVWGRRPGRGGAAGLVVKVAGWCALARLFATADAWMHTASCFHCLPCLSTHTAAAHTLVAPTALTLSGCALSHAVCVCVFVCCVCICV